MLSRTFRLRQLKLTGTRSLPLPNLTSPRAWPNLTFHVRMPNLTYHVRMPILTFHFLLPTLILQTLLLQPTSLLTLTTPTPPFPISTVASTDRLTILNPAHLASPYNLLYTVSFAC